MRSVPSFRSTASRLLINFRRGLRRSLHQAANVRSCIFSHRSRSTVRRPSGSSSPYKSISMNSSMTMPSESAIQVVVSREGKKSTPTRNDVRVDEQPIILRFSFLINIRAPFSSSGAAHSRKKRNSVGLPRLTRRKNKQTFMHSNKNGSQSHKIRSPY